MEDQIVYCTPQPTVPEEHEGLCQCEIETIIVSLDARIKALERKLAAQPVRRN